MIGLLNIERGNYGYELMTMHAGGEMGISLLVKYYSICFNPPSSNDTLSITSVGANDIGILCFIRSKFQFLERRFVLHDTSCIENVIILLFCHSICIIHQLKQGSLCRDIIIGISRL